jgi:PKD repeat protein
VWQTPIGFDNIFVLAKATDAITTDPVQGTAYAIGTQIDGATIIYKGTSAGFIHSGLQNNTTYNYKFYTLNNNYYSAGITASDATDDSEGCTFAVDLGDDINVCGGSSVLLNSGLSTSPYGDSLTIIFNSSAYMDFAEVTKVYMHSGVEINAGTQWDYVVGNWGEDDGVGLMTDLGGGMWMIKFNPLEYYGYSAENSLIGISIVFRNEDGTIIAQNPLTESDFYIDMSINPPSVNHNSVIPLYVTSDITSILWSTGAQTPSISVSSNLEVWVSAMDIYGCVGNDTVNVGIHSLPYVELGLDQTVCSDIEVILDAGAFEEYIWNTDAITQLLTITESGLYQVTVTDIYGCTGFDVVNISFVDYPVADFSYNVISGTQVDFTDLSLNGVSYAWDFNNDNITDNTTAGSVSYTYPALGQYSVKLTVTNACSSDVETKIIYVLSVEDNQLEGLNIYPNPVSEFLTIELKHDADFNILITDILGKVVFEKNVNSTEIVDVSGFLPGLYNISISTDENISNHKIIIK